MDRVWFLTWTTYGTWLPGDERGHASKVRTIDGAAVRHNAPGTDYDAKRRGLQLDARALLAGDSILLRSEQAERLIEQFHETAQHRGWTLLAVAVMANHVHILVGVPGDPEPETLLRDFKSYGSRRLNRLFGEPASGTWWTAGGSTRKKEDRDAVSAAIEYVRGQKYPLVVWVNEKSSQSAGA